MFVIKPKKKKIVTFLVGRLTFSKETLQSVKIFKGIVVILRT